MSNATALSMDPDAARDAQNAGGGRLVASDGRALPLDRTHVSAEASGGVARVTLEQRFRNPHDEPLLVSYLVPLPASGAVSGFSFRVGETRIVGEVDTRHAARQRFEQAMLDGKTAALVDQERTSLFSQQVGNIPPGQEIVCELIIDQPLAWLPEGSWEWRFPTVVGPRYMGEAGRVQDASAISVDVADGPLAVGMTLALAIADTLAEDRRPESPSHALRAIERGGAWEVCFQNDGRVRLDRDVVVRWPVATPEVGVSVEVARPSGERHQDRAYGLLTIVPPGRGIDIEPVPRDLIVLIDTSGSMGGRPLDQARRVICAMIDTLSDRDRLELIEFGSSARRWRREPVAGTRDGRRQAIKWVKALRASGATEMYDAVIEALAPLRARCQRQIVLVTDGYIGFESQIIAAIRDEMPASCRFHTIGVGSAPNRSLTGPAARAGAGVELVIGMDEDAERVARRLLERTTAPLITELEISGTAVQRSVPDRLPDLHAGSPALISLLLEPDGGTIEVRGVRSDGSGVFEHTLEVAPATLGTGHQAIAALYGRERVEDLETRHAAMSDMPDVDAEIERIGLEFQIATRLTSWIAVTENATIDPGRRRVEQTMPHEIPYGAHIEGFGLRAPGFGGASGSGMGQPSLGRTRSGSLRGEYSALLSMQSMPSAYAEGAPSPAPIVAKPRPSQRRAVLRFKAKKSPAPIVSKPRPSAGEVRLGIATSAPHEVQVRRSRHRRPVLPMLLIIIVLAAIATGLWWLLVGGAESAHDRDDARPTIQTPAATGGQRPASPARE